MVDSLMHTETCEDHRQNLDSLSDKLIKISAINPYLYTRFRILKRVFYFNHTSSP